MFVDGSCIHLINCNLCSLYDSCAMQWELLRSQQQRKSQLQQFNWLKLNATSGRWRNGEFVYLLSPRLEDPSPSHAMGWILEPACHLGTVPLCNWLSSKQTSTRQVVNGTCVVVNTVRCFRLTNIERSLQQQLMMLKTLAACVKRQCLKQTARQSALDQDRHVTAGMSADASISKESDGRLDVVEEREVKAEQEGEQPPREKAGSEDDDVVWTALLGLTIPFCLVTCELNCGVRGTHIMFIFMMSVVSPTLRSIIVQCTWCLQMTSIRSKCYTYCNTVVKQLMCIPTYCCGRRSQRLSHWATAGEGSHVPLHGDQCKATAINESRSQLKGCETYKVVNWQPLASLMHYIW